MKCFKCQIEINEPTNPVYGLHPSCFNEWFKAPITAEFVSVKRRSSASTSDNTSIPSPQNTSFFHGKFKKYSAELNGESYILKMRQDEAPELPEVEYLCNQIGKSAGIPVAEFYYIDFMGEKTFVTKNFIKHGTPTDLQHIYHFRNDDEHSCEGIIRAIQEKTQRRHDVSLFVKTLLFDALIGNNDRHGRNLGFIVTAKGSTLSPIYDNVSYLSLESGGMLQAQHNPTGRINTKYTFEPSMHDYIVELKRLGFQDEINEFYQGCKMTHLLTLIENSFCSREMKNALNRLLEKRFEELKYELNS